jgi:hypothetical protein
MGLIRPGQGLMVLVYGRWLSGVQWGPYPAKIKDSGNFIYNWVFGTII